MHNTPMSDQHRRLQTALRLLKAADARGGTRYTTKALQHPAKRKRAITLLAGDVIKAERREANA